ncbi:MAG: glycosyltransferase, partial [Candidatus Methanomethylicia archaeon]
MLELSALALAGIHFGVPPVYYWYAKAKWLSKPWDIRIDPSYRPKVTVVIPTYNEAKLIEAKLDNVTAQVYPKDGIEVLVIDSASTDGTAEVVERWI